MWPDRVWNPGPLTNESGALRGPAALYKFYKLNYCSHTCLKNLPVWFYNAVRIQQVTVTRWNGK